MSFSHSFCTVNRHMLKWAIRQLPIRIYDRYYNSFKNIWNTISNVKVVWPTTYGISFFDQTGCAHRSSNPETAILTHLTLTASNGVMYITCDMCGWVADQLFSVWFLQAIQFLPTATRQMWPPLCVAVTWPSEIAKHSNSLCLKSIWKATIGIFVIKKR